MTFSARTPEEYIESLPDERKKLLGELRKVIKKNLPKGFTETMSYGMLGYVVPHTLYPKGYHTDPALPLPFLALASQKNFIALYHMGLYADPPLLKWFTDQYKKRVPAKLDMGKSCIRFKKAEHIPFDLIGELVSKITPDQWINTYEKSKK
jgi:uncharacterized protein YdhG (YjbR/CyaY superfamily)